MPKSNGDDFKGIKVMQIIFFIAIALIPVAIISIGFLYKSGTVVIGSNGVPYLAENQLINIESHNAIMVETPIGDTGQVYYKQVEGPFLPFYLAEFEPGFIGQTKFIQFAMIPGSLYSGSYLFTFFEVSATEDKIKTWFAIDSLYLNNGSAKVFWSKDTFDSRGTYNLLFKTEGKWYMTCRGLAESSQGFMGFEIFTQNAIWISNNGFLAYPR